MKGMTMFLSALLCPILITGTPYGSMAADSPPSPPVIKGITSGKGPLPEPAPVPVTPPGNDGLLSGMIPGKYSVPSGWSIVRMQNFEGSQPEGELWGRWSGGVSTTKPHDGNKSIGGTYSGDQSSVDWVLEKNFTGSFNELYVSWYEYIESHARFNDEFFLMRLETSDSPWQEIIIDWYWGMDANEKSIYNGEYATLYVVPQGVISDRHHIKFDKPASGSWVQWEVHFRPTVGTNAGSVWIYKNGRMYGSVTNKTVTTTNMANALVQIGGTYSLGCWANTISGKEAWPPETCASDINLPNGCTENPGEGWNIGACYPIERYSPGWCGSFAQPRCYPKQPTLSNFKRFIDDIIVMKR